MVIIFGVLIDFTQSGIKVHKRGCHELDNKRGCHELCNKRSVFLLHFSNG